MPRLSVDVVIPLYNNGQYIKSAITSVLAQTKLPKSIIVVDDGSVDEGERIVKQLINKSKVKILYFRKPNGGPSSARNFGIRKSTAPLVAFLDADDIWDRRKLESHITFFQNSKNLKLAAVYSNAALFDINQKNLSGKKITVYSKCAVAYDDLLMSNIISGSASSVIVKKECLRKVGYFDESMWASEDWDMWARLAKIYDFGFINKPMVYIRLHKSNSSSNLPKMVKGRAQFINKHLSEIVLRPRIVKSIRYKLLNQMVSNFPSFQIKRIYDRELSSTSKELIFGGVLRSLSSLFIVIFGKIKRQINAS